MKRVVGLSLMLAVIVGAGWLTQRGTLEWRPSEKAANGLDALEATGCSFCTRLHFGRELPGEDRRFVRIAYSGIDADRIAEGLGRLKAFVEG